VGKLSLKGPALEKFFAGEGGGSAPGTRPGTGTAAAGPGAGLGAKQASRVSRVGGSALASRMRAERGSVVGGAGAGAGAGGGMGLKAMVGVASQEDVVVAGEPFRALHEEVFPLGGAMSAALGAGGRMLAGMAASAAAGAAGAAGGVGGMVPRGGEKLDPPGEGPGDVSVQVTATDLCLGHLGLPTRAAGGAPPAVPVWRDACEVFGTSLATTST
jgi:hypothetical protein